MYTELWVNIENSKVKGRTCFLKNCLVHALSLEFMVLVIASRPRIAPLKSLIKMCQINPYSFENYQNHVLKTYRIIRAIDKHYGFHSSLYKGTSTNKKKNIGKHSFTLIEVLVCYLTIPILERFSASLKHLTEWVSLALEI